MLDPNSALFQHWTELMRTGDFVGRNRPIGRVTFHDAELQSVGSARPGPWRYLVTGTNPASATELEVRAIRISRSIGQDAATCTLTMDNVRPGQRTWEGADEDPFGVGYLSIDRGAPNILDTSIFGEGAPSDWGYQRNPHARLLTPNILVRTYQGYGSDNLDDDGYARTPDDPEYVHPANDSQLVLTGVWLIDRAGFSGGVDQPTITVEMRDLAKLLIEQPVYPPALPMERFPLTYSPVPKDKHIPASPRKVGRNVAKYDTAAPVMHAQYDANSTISGHKGSHAFDGKPGTYWLSHSYTSPRSSYSFEWLQARCGGHRINEVYAHTKRHGYVCYISVMEGGDWKGSKTIPYSASGHDHSHHAGIHYVKRVVVGKSCRIKVRLPRTYKAQKVRLTFTNLQHITEGPYYDWKVAVREVRCYYTTKAVPAKTITAKVKPGDIADWSLAIKELVSWAGFTWQNAPTVDPLLGVANDGRKLAVWGDFEWLGAGPIVTTPGDYFLNKSFQESVRQIADFIGGIFYVDHTGGAQFRMPNIYGAGNFIADPTSVNLAARIDTHPIELHENINLLGYTQTVDDAAARSEVLVVGKDPDITGKAYVAGGYLLTGDSAMPFREMLKGQLRPMALPADSTKGLATEEECQRMAALVAVRILFAIRQGQARIIAHPGLHIDDQVRIFERVTNENNVHYVSGIDSEMDLRSGSWVMDLTTHWLGRDPDTDWFVNRDSLTPMVQQLPALAERLAQSGASSGWEVQ